MFKGLILVCQNFLVHWFDKVEIGSAKEKFCFSKTCLKLEQKLSHLNFFLLGHNSIAIYFDAPNQFYWKVFSNRSFFCFGSSYTNKFWVMLISRTVLPKSDSIYFCKKLKFCFSKNFISRGIKLLNLTFFAWQKKISCFRI